MTTKVIGYKCWGPYFSGEKTENSVQKLSEFIQEVRSCFEERFDAVGVVRDDIGVAIWIREPDVDCDLDGFYEVAAAYPGQEYVRYGNDHKRFWNHFAGYFGSSYIPSDVPFMAERLAKAAEAEAGNDGQQCLTAAERNPSMLRH